MSYWSKSMEEHRLKFINEVIQNRQQTFQEICFKYDLSRKTGYKWFNRYRKNGENGLKDSPKARLTQNYISDEAKNCVISIRNKYPKRGPKKIHIEMINNFSEIEVVSCGSIGRILKENDLTSSRKYRRHVAQTAPLQNCYNPNDVWSYDFKGWFTTGDGSKCEPLTIIDGASRFLIRCEHMIRKRTNDVWEVLADAFQEYGLPKRIRSDNGPPFATTGIGRLSPLAIKLIKVGVIPEWIQPGCPQENGRHERFHLTLKNETASPPALDLNLQILKMQQFLNYYNYERPHEALNQLTPGFVYATSDTKWDKKYRSPEYSEEYEIRRVDKGGSISWKGHSIFLSESLWQEPVGIKEEKVGIMAISYGPIQLGKIDLNKGFKRI